MSNGNRLAVVITSTNPEFKDRVEDFKAEFPNQCIFRFEPNDSSSDTGYAVCPSGNQVSFQSDTDYFSFQRELFKALNKCNEPDH